MFEGYSASLQLYRLPAKVCDEKLTRTDVDIHQAGKMWCKDKNRAMSKYGNISEWDTSSVTQHSRMFRDRSYYAIKPIHDYRPGGCEDAFSSSSY